MGRGSPVGMATRYGLDGPGIESRWGGRDFPHPSRPALGSTQPPIQWVPGLSPGGKRPGGGVEHPPPSRAEVKERAKLYIYSPFWAFVAYYRVNFTFTFTKMERHRIYSCLLHKYSGFKSQTFGLSTVGARFHSFSFQAPSVQLSFVCTDWYSVLEHARLETLTS